MNWDDEIKVYINKIPKTMKDKKSGNNNISIFGIIIIYDIQYLSKRKIVCYKIIIDNQSQR